MNIRTYFLLPAVAFIAWTSSAQAKCPGLSAAGVSIKGEVIEHIKGAGMLKIKTEKCGKITVGIPAQTWAELGPYYEECEVGSFAFIDGDMTIGIMQAKVLGCL